MPNGERERFEVLMESVNSKLELLAEGHGVLVADNKLIHQKLDGMAADLSIVKVDVSVLKKDVSVLKKDVSVLKKDVSVLKKDVSVLKTDVSVLKTDVSVLKTDVSVLKKGMRTVKDHLGLDGNSGQGETKRIAEKKR